MSVSWLLAANSWKETVRSRFHVITIVFSVILIMLSLVLGMLAVDQEQRVLLDFGLSVIELLALIGAVYGAATTILREMETKTIYLILTRPVSRTQYLLGRYLGLLLSAAAAAALMSAVHLAVLFLKGWQWDWHYLRALLGIFLKLGVTSALALTVALFSSSALTALVITGILWSLGHFLPEIRYLIDHGTDQRFLIPVFKALAYIPPDLQLLNGRDRLSAASLASPEAPLWVWLAYSIAYAAAWLAAGRELMRRKEF